MLTSVESVRCLPKRNAGKPQVKRMPKPCNGGPRADRLVSAGIGIARNVSLLVWQNRPQLASRWIEEAKSILASMALATQVSQPAERGSEQKLERQVLAPTVACSPALRTQNVNPHPRSAKARACIHPRWEQGVDKMSKTPFPRDVLQISKQEDLFNSPFSIPLVKA